MTEANGQGVVRGLSTVALLKLHFDTGQDHVAMFEPFVLDGVSVFAEDGFSLEQVRSAVLTRSQLDIPLNTTRTLIERAAQKGYVRSEGGRYFVGDRAFSTEQLQAERKAVEARQAALGESLIEFGQARGCGFDSTEDALGAILAFLDEYHVSLALSMSINTESPLAEEDDELPESTRRNFIVAAFLEEHIENGTWAVPVIQELLEGFVLQNALLLKDIASIDRSFGNLEVFIDTLLVLGLAGFRGESTQLAYKEFCVVLRDAGARIAVFDDTMAEARSILSIYEDRLGTAEGRASLHQTDITRHMLTKHLTSSDVAVRSALLERNLASFGIRVKPRPKHVISSTLDERTLTKALADPKKGERDPRVVHDVDCIAAVITLREAHQYPSLDDAHAVFVTTSGLTVRNTHRWWAEQGVGGVPPIVHYLALSNLAWLKKPASATNLKLHELVALCAAALRPSKKAWEAFIAYLQQLVDNQELTTDELTAVVVDKLTDRVLAEVTLEDEVEAENLSEVVSRVREKYETEAATKVADAESRAQQEAERADGYREAENAVRANVLTRSRVVARYVARGVAIFVLVILALGFIASLWSYFSERRIGVLGIVLAVVFAAVGFASAWGFTVKDWLKQIEAVIADKLASWWLGMSDLSQER